MNMAKPHILDLFRSNATVFTFKEISLLWGETNRNLLKRRVHYYVKTGKLYPIRRGIYGKDKSYNKFELATKMYTPSYISFETVLQKEGVLFQYYNSIFTASYVTRELTCDGQVYVYKKIKNSALANALGLEKRENYFIATKERAFMDMLYLHTEYHFDNLSSIDWDFCSKLLPIYASKSLEDKLNSYHKKYT